MASTGELLELLSSCVATNRLPRLDQFLKQAGARRCATPAGATQALPPMVNRIDFEFAGLFDARKARMVVIRTDDRLLQVALSLEYPRRLVLGPARGAWRALIKRSRRFPGSGERFRAAGKKSWRHRHEDTMVLASLHHQGKSDIVELKVASGQFWS